MPLLPLVTRVRHAIRNVFQRARVERELDQELEGVWQTLLDEKLASGLTEDEARRQARLELGSIMRVKDDVRDVRLGAWLDALGRDLRFGTRMLRRYPGSSLVVVLTLGLGAGVTTALFALADAVLFRPLPYAEADRLVTVWESFEDLPQVDVAPLNYVDWAARATSFDELAAYENEAANLTGEGTPERLAIAEVTPNLLPMLGVEPRLGRWFTGAEGRPGTTGAVVLSYDLWQRRFGGDQMIVGRAVQLDGALHVVVGVMPAGFHFPRQGTQAWIAVDYQAGAGVQSRDAYFLAVVGRLGSGVTLEDAGAEMRAISAALAQTYPDNDGSSAVVIPLQDYLAREVRTSYVLLLGASGLILLIACANVGGLLVARSLRRQWEFVVRASLGAGLAQIVRQLVIESLVLASAGALLGVVLAAQAFDALSRLMPETLRGSVPLALDARLLAFALVVAVGSAVLFSLAPLRVVGRRMDIFQTERESTPGAAGRRTQAVLVAGEVALAVVVLFSTGLMVKTIVNLQRVDPGFRVDGVLTARVELTAADYPTAAQQAAFYRGVIDGVERLPGVVSAGFTTRLPLTEAIGAASIRMQDGGAALGERPPVAFLRAVTPGYLPSLGVSLVAGRGVSERDTAETPPVALVSETLAAQLGGDVVGAQVAFGGEDNPWLTVVGVVGDTRTEGIDVPAQRGTLYLPFTFVQQVGFLSPRDLVVRTAADPMAVAGAVQQVIWELNPNQTIANVQALESIVSAQSSQSRVQAGLFSTFSVLALFMAALGVNGLLSFVVAARTREWGVRMALGATRADLVSLATRDSAVWLGAGLAAGALLAALVSRAMASLLYGVDPFDAWSLVVALVVLAGVGVAAAVLPVRRATRVDPALVLRQE